MSPDRSLRLLLVDDDPLYSRLIGALLSQQRNVHCLVQSAATFAEAMDQIRTRPFDVVLLDLGLPDSEGHTTLTRFIEAVPDLPVVVLTGLDDPEIGFLSLQAGAQDYLVKSEVTADSLGRAIRYAIERFRMQQELRSLSLQDQLTGVLNRRGFLHLAEQELKVARTRNAPLSLLFADLDAFKSINDRFGHPIGDCALRAAAAALKSAARSSDVVARIGGDEFVALLIDAPATEASAVARAFLQSLSAAPLPDCPEITLRASVGAATWEPRSEEGLAELIQRADRDLYRAKGRPEPPII